MISTFESKIVPGTNMGFAQVWGASSIEVDPRLVPGTNLGYILHRFYTRLVPGTSLGYSPHRVDTRLEFGWVLHQVDTKFVPGINLGSLSVESTQNLFPEQIWVFSLLSQHRSCSWIKF